MRTIIRLAALAALVSAVVVFATGRDIFYATPVAGEYRVRAAILWFVGSLALYFVGGVV